jgi:hypothetical protein
MEDKRPTQHEEEGESAPRTSKCFSLRGGLLTLSLSPPRRSASTRSSSVTASSSVWGERRHQREQKCGVPTA